MAARGSARIRLDRPSGWESLTPSEERVVALLTEGLSNREIALRLEISCHTVDSHMKSVLAKLAMQSRTQVALAAVRRAWAGATAPVAPFAGQPAGV